LETTANLLRLLERVWARFFQMRLEIVEVAFWGHQSQSPLVLLGFSGLSRRRSRVRAPSLAPFMASFSES
jgi:hypothetical protein